MGSVHEMLNSSGSIVARYSYDPDGVTTLVSGSNQATKQYAGMYLHQPSGEYFTKWRIYDPLTATWRSRDPIGEDGGYNLYEYCGDDPVDMTDPQGLVAGVDDAIEGEVIVGVGIGALLGDYIWQTHLGQKLYNAIANAVAQSQAQSQAQTQTQSNCPKDPCQGLREQLALHLKKLFDYMQDPDAFDNLGLLKGASPERRNQIINGRIKSLAGQIENFAKQLAECEKKNKK